MTTADETSAVEKPEAGSIHVHKKVIMEIIDSAVKGVNGVRLVSKNWVGVLGEVFGMKNYPGISIRENRDHSFSVAVNVCVTQGLHIPDIALRTQDAIRKAIEKTVDLELKVVNVNILGIERRRS